jgi:hypothetical protein
MNKNHNKPSWVGDPAISPREQVALVSINAVNSVDVPGNNVNSILLTLGNPSTGETFTTDAIMMGPPGLISLPLGPGTVDSTGAALDPSATSATGANAIAACRDDQWAVFGIRDTRTQPNAGNAQPGETTLFASGSPAAVSCKLDGSVTLSTQTSSGQLVYLSISPTAASFTSPWGTIIFDQASLRINHISGASFYLGGAPSTIPSPLNTLIGSVCTISASNLTLGAPFINLGDGMNTPFLSSALPLTITAPTLTLGIPLLTLSDLTTPMVIVAPSLLTINATEAIAVTAGGAIGITGSSITLSGATTVTGLLTAPMTTGLLGIAPPTGGPLTPGAPAVGVPFVIPA